MKKPIFILYCLGLLAPLSFAQTYVSGAVSGVWNVRGSPYYITDSVCVLSGDSLRIIPGCEIIFTGHYKFCVDANALLKAIGTETDSILFTALDTTVIGDSTTGHYGIRFYNAADGCTLSYCRIEYGQATGFIWDDPNAHGGGILCYSASNPVITHNTIERCFGYYGGGIFCYASSPTITDNIIRQNLASTSGGGIASNQGSNPVIRHNFIVANKTVGDGGGISCFLGSNPIITDNTITADSAQFGGGISCGENTHPFIANNRIYANKSSRYGGGIYCWRAIPTIASNIINNNVTGYASNGGGIYLTESNSIIVNNIISHNSTGYNSSGGGIYSYDNSNSILINNTITENWAHFYGGGICFRRYSTAIILNNVIWDNTAITSGDEIYLLRDGADYNPCTLLVAYSDIDTSECVVDSGVGIIIWDIGNIDAAPLFSDTLFHLLGDSPCIDTGSESVYVALWDTLIFAPMTDIEGISRPYGTMWDIGAYEYHGDYVKEYNSKPNNTSLVTFPNPFNSSCLIITAPDANIEIFDIEGRTVARFKETPVIWTPPTSIASGIYLIQAIIKGKKTVRQIVLIR